MRTGRPHRPVDQTRRPSFPQPVGTSPLVRIGPGAEPSSAWRVMAHARRTATPREPASAASRRAVNPDPALVAPTPAHDAGGVAEPGPQRLRQRVERAVAEHPDGGEGAGESRARGGRGEVGICTVDGESLERAARAVAEEPNLARQPPERRARLRPRRACMVDDSATTATALGWSAMSTPVRSLAPGSSTKGPGTTSTRPPAATSTARRCRRSAPACTAVAPARGHVQRSAGA